MTPAEVGHLAPVEIQEMMDGIDWMNDREWERQYFIRTTDGRAAADLFEYSYPHFRSDRVVEIIRSESDDQPPPAKHFKG